jgi:thioesterase domain-containing protein
LVTDRFGSYGLVGVMIWSPTDQSLEVDTFLLSCRVLGRGVEHQMLAHLGKIALQRGLDHVSLRLRASPRNQPALNFLQKIAGPLHQNFRTDGVYLHRMQARVAAALRFNADAVLPHQIHTGAQADALIQSQGSFRAARPKFSQCRRIALEAVDISRILLAIEEKMRKPAERQTLYVAPRTESEKLLCKIWQEGLHRERVGVKDNFFALGGNSLLAVRLFAEAEKQTGRKLPLVTIFQAPTVEHLAQVIGRPSRTDNSSIMAIQPQGSRPSLFLVHGAGGDLLWGYANLAPHLGADQPVYGLTSQAWDGAEEFATIEVMAARYVEAVQQVQPHGPYYLGGYCFGGNVAYDMARQLHAKGEETALVALVDCAPANCGYQVMPWWQPAFGLKFARNLFYWLADFAKHKPEERREFIRRKARTWRRKLLRKCSWAARSKSATDVDLEEVIDLSKIPEEQLRLWQLHLNALEQHVSRPYAGRVTLFRTRGQPLFCSLEEDFGWGKLATGGVDIRLVPGSHETIFMEPAVQPLAKEVKACIVEATVVQHVQQCGTGRTVP